MLMIAPNQEFIDCFAGASLNDCSASSVSRVEAPNGNHSSVKADDPVMLLVDQRAGLGFRETLVKSEAMSSASALRHPACHARRQAASAWVNMNSSRVPVRLFPGSPVSFYRYGSPVSFYRN
jgi:hypothetical protein